MIYIMYTNIMFIKKSWFTKNNKRYYTYQLAESYRDPVTKKVKHRIIANISPLGKDIIDKLEILLKSPSAVVIPDINAYLMDKITQGFKESYAYGLVLLLYLYMRKLGIIDCLKVLPERVRTLIIGLILNRIIEPRSKLGSVSWIKTTAFGHLFQITTHDLHVNEIYRAMDKLYDNTQKVLNEFFKANRKGTFLLLYDVTSVFFHGKGPEALSKYGFNRDGHDDTPQIILTLCLNEDKLPVYFDILEGNMTDKKTVIPLINRLKDMFDLEGAIFIGDRGMVTMDNIKFLEDEGIDYIVALRHKEAKRLIYEENIQPELFDKELPMTILYKEEGIKRRYVLCGSEYRKEHDLKILDRLIEKGRHALEEIKTMVENKRLKDPDKIIRRAQKKLTQSRAEEFFDFTYTDGRFIIIEKTDVIKKAQALCGYYILQTTLIEATDKEIESHYKGLKFVEDAFRLLKSLVNIRPIFHWLEKRVRTHVLICILAQTIANKLRDAVKDNGWDDSLDNLFDTFHKISLGVFEIEGKAVNIISRLSEEAKEILNLIGIDDKPFSNLQEARRLCRLI